MSEITNENHLNWFDNICAQSRAKFVSNELEVHGQLSDELISKNECYTFIKEKMKRSQVEGEDILWKLPIVLLFLGCSLVIVMAFSVLCHCLLMRVKNSKFIEELESETDICNSNKKSWNSDIVKSSPSSNSSQKKKSKCCSCK